LHTSHHPPQHPSPPPPPTPPPYTTLFRSRPGVARAVIEEIQGRIVGVPTPRRPATALPLVPLPRADAEVLATVRGIVRVRVAHRSEEHTSELQSRFDLVCRLLLEKKNLRR